MPSSGFFIFRLFKLSSNYSGGGGGSGTCTNCLAPDQDAVITAVYNFTRTILGVIGDVVGSASFDGSGNVFIYTNIGDGTITNNKLADSSVTINKLSTSNTPSSSTFLRGDGTWAAFTAGFTYTQNTPSSTWIINHGLGYKPIVSIYTLGGQEIEADILHTSDNQTQIFFSVPTTGIARLV